MAEATLPRPITNVIFLPHYAEVLESVVRQAEQQGVVDLECRADLDPWVVAGQVRAYGHSTGRALRCKPLLDRVEVRAGRRAARAAHPTAQGA